MRRVFAGEPLADDVSVCVFGSLARDEFTDGSDHDWAILTNEPHAHDDSSVVAALQIVEKHLGKEDHAPGNTKVFGMPFDVRTLVESVGLDGDSNTNLTRRMLLLLESRSLTGTVHEAGWRSVLDHYMNHGVKNYRPPRFPLNDVVRYWRTVCVDFEGKHRDPNGNDPKWATRNAKLRTSRKLLFAGGLLPIMLCHVRTTDEIPSFLATWFTAVPLDKVAAAFIWADMQPEGARALATYDRWLSIQQDKSARDELRTLTRDTRRSSQLFADVVDLGRQFERTLLALLFDSPLAAVSRQFLIF